MAIGRGEYPKLSTPLGLFPRWLSPRGNNPSGVDNLALGEITLVGLTNLDIHRFRWP